MGRPSHHARTPFLPIGLLVKGTSLADGGTYPDLTWSNAFFGNLIPATIGNVFGGSVMVGLVYWLVYRRPAGRPPSDRPTA